MTRKAFGETGKSKRMNETLRRCISIATLGFSASLAGCIVEAGSAVASGIPVSGPPPAPVVETPPPPPAAAAAPRAVWIGGYWHWTGMQYAWIPGHWEAARQGTQWRGPSYPLRDGTYFYEPGHWSPASPASPAWPSSPSSPASR